MKEVDDNTFNKVYDNKENQTVLSKATRRFRRDIPHDDLVRCKLIATWKTIQKFKKDKNTKFTSYLYKRAVWECLDFINEQKRVIKPLYSGDVDNIPSREDGYIDEIVENLPYDQQNILHQRFTYGMTLKEIGVENGYSYETARQKVNKAVLNLKKQNS